MHLRWFLGTIFFVLLGLTLVNAQTPAVNAELHWNICETSEDIILNKLGLELKKKSQRNVSYYDLWSDELGDFEHFSEGVILRQRVSEENEKTATVKIKFALPQIEEGFPWGDIKCESDLNSESINHYCALNSEHLVSSDQEAFLREHGSPVILNTLKEFGPTLNTVWKLKRPQQEELVLEKLSLPNEDIFELSTRSDGPNAQGEFKALTQWFESRKIKLCKKQEGKTRQILEAYR